MPKPRCRTGCITCRIRRIKCDEAKPSCVRCSSTGRICDGYLADRPKDELPAFGTHHHTLRRTILPSIPSAAATDFELRAIQHFQRKTVPALAASFESDFWDSVVLQISATELPVRSAIVAFSSLHECFEGSKDSGASSDGLERTLHYGLKQYNDAVRRTAQLLDMNDQSSCGIALVSCLLFNCLELLQDNYPAAITHLTGGLRLLHFCQNVQKTKQLQSSSSSLNNRLRQIFGRMIVATMFLGDTHYGAELVPELFAEAPSIFLTVAEARDSLDFLFLSAYCFLRPLSKEDPSQISTTRILERTQLLNRLQHWYRLFQKLVDATNGSFTAKDSTGVVLLEIHYTSLFIMLDTAIDNSKVFSSTLAPPFVRTTSLVESLLAQPEPSNPSVDGPPRCKLPRYSFDLGVIGPLFYTAVKCWNPSVRTKAIFLLQHPNIPRREGMWNPGMAALLAQKIIDVEEELVSNTTSLGLDAQVDETQGQSGDENIKKKNWFDIERPTEDMKKLKVLVGSKPEEKRERKEEVITW